MKKNISNSDFLPVRCRAFFDFRPSITYENNLLTGYTRAICLNNARTPLRTASFGSPIYYKVINIIIVKYNNVKIQ